VLLCFCQLIGPAAGLPDTFLRPCRTEGDYWVSFDVRLMTTVLKHDHSSMSVISSPGWLHSWTAITRDPSTWEIHENIPLKILHGSSNNLLVCADGVLFDQLCLQLASTPNYTTNQLYFRHNFRRNILWFLAWTILITWMFFYIRRVQLLYVVDSIRWN